MPVVSSTPTRSGAELLSWIRDVVEEHIPEFKVKEEVTTHKGMTITRKERVPAKPIEEIKTLNKQAFLDELRERLSKLPKTSFVDASKTPLNDIKAQIMVWDLVEPLIVDNVAKNEIQPLLDEVRRSSEELKRRKQIDDDLILICLLE